ncbi:zinc-binding dehydrogenase [Actinopolyspora halophila]|uniref:zinc-binding dehydrogenase n=1 Tax=Actinopolyspora halophila TaxID=1850 RepID=UPI0003743F5C|nr:zinc-binding dehydrogenase [Actinopolyspora halophila]
MQMVQARGFGGPEVLQVADAPALTAGPTEVVVKVSTADVLAIDVALRKGEGRELFSVEPPFVPGTGVGGTVISVGDEVDVAWVGQRVVAITGVMGGYAEQAVIAERELVVVPDELELDTATALINDGRTALALLEAGDIRPREWVLVLPGASGLGLVLIQLARACGARVIAGARGTTKLDLALQAGAEATVDYAHPDSATRLREATGGSGIDVVFDGVGGHFGRTAFEATARGGRFIGYGDSSGAPTEYSADEAQDGGVRVLGPELVHIGGTDKAKRLAEQAVNQATAGQVRPIVGQTFPLERAADAHAAVENRTAVGKTLLFIP